ncbi:hypothetical protein AB1N83_008688 [Pleurotus pulmonarius]
MSSAVLLVGGFCTPPERGSLSVRDAIPSRVPSVLGDVLEATPLIPLLRSSPSPPLRRPHPRSHFDASRFTLPITLTP